MKLTMKVTTLLSVVMFLCLVPAVLLIWQHQRQLIMEQAYTQARAVFNTVVVVRQWVAENQDRVHAVPAVVTKELSTYAESMVDFRVHITSDHLVNPENAPDAFEIEALDAFESGVGEYAAIRKVEPDGEVYRYMAPLYINDSCLSCHGYQGYEVGQLRGGISISVPLADIRRAIALNNRVTYAVGFMVYLGLVLTVAVLLYRLVLRHLSVMRDAAVQIQAGTYGVQTGIRTGDEIESLSVAFDRMSERIARNEENLRDRLQDAVSKYVQLVEDLEDKNAQLKSINRLKTDIIDAISHDIRTPLTKILSYAEVLDDARLKSNEGLQSKSVSSIKANAVIMKQMFTDILTLSRLEHEQYEYHYIPVDLAVMVDDVFELLESDAVASGVDLSREGAEILEACVDGESFHSALVNVIGNAVKYSAPNGSVTVALDTDDSGWCRIRVVDNGVGIAEDEVENVFSRFFRGSNVKRAFSGSGLGMSIVSRVVKAHGGMVSIASRLGEGTTVTIEIPARRVEIPTV